MNVLGALYSLQCSKIIMFFVTIFHLPKIFSTQNSSMGLQKLSGNKFRQISRNQKSKLVCEEMKMICWIVSQLFQNHIWVFNWTQRIFNNYSQLRSILAWRYRVITSQKLWDCNGNYVHELKLVISKVECLNDFYVAVLSPLFCRAIYL